MLEIRAMHREEMKEYLDSVKKGVLPHPNIQTQNIKEMVDDFGRKTQNDSEFILYCYTGGFESFKDNINNIETSDVNLAVLRIGKDAEHDILMMGYLAQIIDFDSIIYAEYGGNDFFLEILKPKKHVPVIKTNDDFRVVWNKKILPYIKRIEEMPLSYAVSMLEIDKLDDENVYLSVSGLEAYDLITESWRKHIVEEGIEQAIGKRAVHISLKKDDAKIVISEYEDKYIKDLKRLLVELQEDLISIDRYHTLTMNRAYREKYYKYVLQTIKDNNGIIFLAKKDGDVVGAVAGYIETPDEEDKMLNRCPKKGRISELVVTERVRGYGVGKKLIEKIEQYFREHDCEFSRLTVLESNQIAKQLYTDMGYRPVEVELSKKIKINSTGNNNL